MIIEKLKNTNIKEAQSHLKLFCSYMLSKVSLKYSYVTHLIEENSLSLTSIV